MMAKQDLMESCLRIVSNRCRNLRKQIDKARVWEQAMQGGAAINEEQQKTVDGIPRKEALLSELQEILRKQTALVEQFQGDVNENNKENATHHDSNIKPSDADNNTTTTATTTDSTVDGEKSAPPTPTKKDTTTPTPTPVPSTSTTTTTTTTTSDDNNNNNNNNNINNNTQHPDSISTVTQIDRDDELPDTTTTNGNASENTVLPKAKCMDSVVTSTTDNNDNKSHINQTISTATSPITLSSASTVAVYATPHTVSGDKYARDVTAGQLEDQHHNHHNGVYASGAGNGTMMSQSTHISKIIDELEQKHSKDLESIKTACVQAVLNLFHVSDFLKQPGSRDSIMAYLSSMDARHVSKPLTDLDFDLLCYFHVMLTSPNGYVAHSEAVDVSTAHCLEYLKASRSEAFKGTTYADLAEIVHAIATCPLMTERGGDKAGITTQSQYIDDTTLINNMQG